MADPSGLLDSFGNLSVEVDPLPQLCWLLELPLLTMTSIFGDWLCTDDLLALDLACSTFHSPLRVIHWELSDLISLVDLSAKRAAERLVAQGNCEPPRENGSSNNFVSLFVEVRITAGWRWTRILWSLRHWDCAHCGTISTQHSSVERCTMCETQRAWGLPPLKEQASKGASAERSEGSGMSQSEEAAAVQARSQQTIAMHIARMLALAYHPHEQTRGSSAIAHFASASKAKAAVVVELGGADAIVKGMNSCASNRIVQRSGEWLYTCTGSLTHCTADSLITHHTPPP
jgi:hypothetical protein